ncbi:MAG: DNA gyrase subunit A [Bacillota bacterium]
MAVEIGKVVPIDINEEMKHSYLDYAMSVIVGRALPDVRDGLKPVHRRIVYGMHELGMTPDKPHRKSANIVGYVLQKFHPHGDVAVYDALVRLAQDFSCRYPLIDGHGNFGSLDGDAPAAMRYTEARMARITLFMLSDIEKNTVDFLPNYDGTTEEPVVLPSRLPNLLINGSSGIAVGMATNIPPHNLGEVVDGVVTLIDNPEATVDDLLRVIKGPDFPTGGLIVGGAGLQEVYQKGRGVIKMRARTTFEKMGGGKVAVIINEIPYMVNKARLVEKIAELVKEKKIDGITDLRDESDRHGVRVVIEVRRDVNPQVVLNQLYKHTQVQETFGAIMLALVKGKPQTLNLRALLLYYLEHQKEVVTRRTQFDLDKARERLHIVEGLRIALDHIDEVINTIRSSRTVEIARKALMTQFELSQKQADAILDMRLQRLTGLERERVDQEYRELREKIKYLSELLADEGKIYGVIKKEILEIKEKFADPRRTAIIYEDEVIEKEDLIVEEDVVITVTDQGYIKRIPLETYRRQKRGGRGVTGMATKAEDYVRHLFVTTTHNYLLFFTNKGKVYRLKVHEIPEAGRQAKGTAIVNLLPVTGEEKITAIISVPAYRPGLYLFMATRRGIVKKTGLEYFENIRRDGIIAINLDPGDELKEVLLTDGNREVLLGTKKGLAVRFREEQVTPHGRASRGVRGITLQEDDEVIGVDLVREGAGVLTVTENGYGKRTPIEEYRLTARGGKGIINMKVTPKNGFVIGLQLIGKNEEIMLVSREGIVIRMRASEIPTQGRATQGVTLMRTGENDKVVALARIGEE